MNTQVSTAKKLARELKSALSTLENNEQLEHSQLLEVVAKGLGHRNWHAFLASNVTEAVTKNEVTPPIKWSPLDGVMSDAMYQKKFGQCPVCGSDQIEGDSSPEIDGNEAWQEVGCTHCTASWKDFYTLNGYSELDIPDIAKEPNAKEIFAVERYLREHQLSIESELPEWLSESKMEEDYQEFLTEKLTGTSAYVSMHEEGGREKALSKSKAFAREMVLHGSSESLIYLRSQYFSFSLFLEALSKKLGTEIKESML